MTDISIQKQPAALTGLEECESFGEPVGALPCKPMPVFEGELAKGSAVHRHLGVRARYAGARSELTEFCYLLEGHWRFTSESGVVSEVKQAIAGSSQKAGKALPR
ncbi:MAG: hypothetical protein CM15mP84_11070 [Cellvibrionales bacterium]|nr:MAG: hypothetical protein CM15mP84_11070 [Cellvibrionales bacterium]